MGCQGPKSAISVRDEHTFLDLSVQQVQVSKEEKEYWCIALLLFPIHIDHSCFRHVVYTPIFSNDLIGWLWCAVSECEVQGECASGADEFLQYTH